MVYGRWSSEAAPNIFIFVERRASPSDEINLRLLFIAHGSEQVIALLYYTHMGGIASGYSVQGHALHTINNENECYE